MMKTLLLDGPDGLFRGHLRVVGRDEAGGMSGGMRRRDEGMRGRAKITN
jgi:hypothetical protein